MAQRPAGRVAIVLRMHETPCRARPAGKALPWLHILRASAGGSHMGLTCGALLAGRLRAEDPARQEGAEAIGRPKEA